MNRIAKLAVAAAVLLALAAPAQAGGRHQLSGVAAYYDLHYHGRTASGAPYDPRAFTAAHKTLPFGTRLKVTDIRSGRTVEVTVNDHGPFNRGRMIDLSLAAAKKLGMIERGLVHVRAEILP